MWSTDHENKYPSRLEAVAPDYIKEISTCPAGGDYRYEFGPDAPSNAGRHDDFFLVRCSGSQHTEAGLEGDFPAYCSAGGEIEREEDMPRAH
jgi:hypothetical protein